MHIGIICLFNSQILVSCLITKDFVTLNYTDILIGEFLAYFLLRGNYHFNGVIIFMRHWTTYIGSYQVSFFVCLLIFLNSKKRKEKRSTKLWKTYQALDSICTSCAFHKQLIHNLRDNIANYNSFSTSLKTKSRHWLILKEN